MSDALDPSKPADATIIAKLNDVLGNFFSSTVAEDAASWDVKFTVRGIVVFIAFVRL